MTNQQPWKSLVILGVCAISFGTLAGFARSHQPADEVLPPGYSRHPVTGGLVASAPAGVRFQRESLKNDAVEICAKLPLRSLSMDSSGHVRGLVLHGRPLGMNHGTVVRCRSVTLASDGSLSAINFAATSSNGDGSGCELVVTIDGETTKVDCFKNECTTSCDVAMIKDEVTGVMTIFSRCRTSS